MVLVFVPIQRQNLFLGGVGIHTTSAPSTAGTSTGAGALIFKPGSAWLETGSRPGAARFTSRPEARGSGVEAVFRFLGSGVDIF